MTQHILVVDDAATVRMYHRKMLGDAGWTIDEAVNGIEALEKVMSQPKDQPFDLFVVVRELRRLGPMGQAPVLMVSTESQTHDATAARDAGANFYLIKPAKPSDLVLTAALMLGDAPAAQRAAEQQLATGARA